MQAMTANEFVNASGMKIHNNRILLTNIRVYTAWEPATDHTTITFVDGKKYGLVGSKPVPNFLQLDDYDRAYEAIQKAFPGLKGYKTHGRIEVIEN
jgi:hypothetical protein